MSKLIIPSQAELDKFYGRMGHNSGHMCGGEERMKFKGFWRFVLTDEQGNVKQVVEKENLVVNAGFQLIADSVGHPSSRPPIISHIGVGTDTTAPAAGNTALIAQLTRVAGTYSYASKVITMTATFAAGVATGAITEAGVFNASTAGTMLNRVTFSVINKGSLDALTCTFTFTMT